MTKATAVPSRPTATTFHKSVVYLIGKLSGWEAYVSVQAKDVLDDALRLAGIDPSDSPWPLTGRDGLYRRVGFAVRNQCRGHCGKRDPLCTILGKGEWALTAVGLAEAQALRESFETPEVVEPVEPAKPTGPNATSKWLEQHYLPLYTRLHSYLERKMPKSAELDKVDDHIQTFFSNLIRRDSLRTRIEEGASIPYSQVCAWARRSAISEIRDEGTEPVCRLQGALTKKEQGMYDPTNWTEQVIPNTINTNADILGVNTYASHDDGGVVADPMSFVVADDDVEADVLDEDAFNEALKAVGAALEAEIKADKDPDFHMELLRDRYILGLTVKEITEKYGMDRNKATVALGRIRKAVARHRDEIEEEFLR